MIDQEVELIRQVLAGDTAMNKTYTEFGGVVTHVEGSAFTLRTSTGRSVTFYLPDGELARERPREHKLPVVGLR
jgi:hypothetical protein